MARRPVTITTTAYVTSLDEVFYPEAAVHLGDLSGPEGNANLILSRVVNALEEAGVDPSEYLESARAKDYAHLVFVTRSYLRVFETGPGLPGDE